MEQLVPLPSITHLSPRITRVLGQNPGKFTLQGTNTYLLGTRAPRILVDTGEGREAYLGVLEEALLRLREEEAAGGDGEGGQLVSDVVVTHKHADHHGGLPGVVGLLERLWASSHPASNDGASTSTGTGTPSAPFPYPRIHKYPLPPGVTDASVASTLSALPPPLQEHGFAPLADGQTLLAPGTTVHVLHTPGHTADSVCLCLAEEQGVLTADTVLGQGTAVFEDLAAYVASLERVLSAWPGAEVVYPGHGPVVCAGRTHVRQYIAHRLEREAQIVAVLNSPAHSSGGEGQGEGEADGKARAWTARGIVGVLYSAYPQSLWPAAERGVRLHLSKLEGEGRVRRRERELVGEGDGEEWEVVRAREAGM